MNKKYAIIDLDIGHDCVHIRKENNRFYDMKCEFKFCFLCTFDQEKIFTLRGLCDDQNLIDTKYVFLHSLLSKGGEKTFRGLIGRTTITFDEAAGTWNIVKHVPLKKTNG